MQEKSGKEGWPVLVKSGSVTVKIYRTVNRGVPSFTVSYHEGGGRRLRQFRDLKEAKAEAKIIADRLNAGQGEALHLTGKDRDAYVYAMRKLKHIDTTLPAAIDEYVEAKEVGVPLLAAAQLYRHQHHGQLPSKSVTEAVAEFLAAKKSDGRSVRYLADCKARLNRFAGGFKTEIKMVRTADIDAWLRGLKLSPRSRNNFRTVICSLFSFARSAGYLPKGPTEAEAVAIANDRGGEIEVFSPAEYGKLLKKADRDLLPFIVFGGLCGLRSAEILRLQWEQVNWPEGVVEIRGGVAKTGTRRLAPLPDAAAAWLSSFKARTGPVVGRIKLYERIDKLCTEAEVEWKSNALRHSFGTYRMALLKDAIRVSYEMGNSPGIVRQHYDRVAVESLGKAWFAIMPTAPGNVIAMPKANKGAA